MLPCAFGSIVVRSAHLGDLPVIGRLMAPFVAQRELLARTEGEMWSLLPQSFLAEVAGRAVGFAALEVYSQKLSEIQCLSYEESALAPEIIAALLQACLGQAREHLIREVMAVVPPHLESTLGKCGFRVILPGQKRAMFVRTGRGSADGAPSPPPTPLPGIDIRPATIGDVPSVARFLVPFIARDELLPRTEEELRTLLRHGFVAEAMNRPPNPAAAGLAAPVRCGGGTGSAGCIVGFTALEIYSEKLAEVQCVSVDEAYRSQGIGRRLVTLCVDRARQLEIAETLAITAREEVLCSCGFDDYLPGAKIALFVRNR